MMAQSWWDSQGIEGLLPGEMDGGAYPTRITEPGGGYLADTAAPRVPSRLPSVPGLPTTGPGYDGSGITGGMDLSGGIVPAGGTAPQGGGDIQAQVRAILGNRPATVANLKAVESQLAAIGVRLEPNRTLGADGQPTNYDIVLPNGQMVDVIPSAATGGGGAWQWLAGAGGGTGGGTTGGTSAGGVTNGVFTGGGQYPLASVMGEGLLRPWDTPFTAPTMDEVRNSPGYATRLKAGQEVIERSAASKGTLLTGGTAKDLTQWGQDYGQNAYDSEYSRRLGEYQQAYGIYQNNGNTQYNRLSDMTNRGAQAAAAGAGVNSSFGQGGASSYGDIGNANAAGTAAGGAAWGGAVSGIGQSALQAYLLSQVLNKPGTTAVPRG